MLLENHDYNEIFQHYYDKYEKSSSYANKNTLTKNEKLLRTKDYLDEQIEENLSTLNNEIIKIEEIYLNHLFSLPFQKSEHKRDTIDWSSTTFLEEYNTFSNHSEFFKKLTDIHQVLKKIKRKIGYIADGTFISIMHDLENLRGLFDEITEMEIQTKWNIIKVNDIAPDDIYNNILYYIETYYDNLVDLDIRRGALKWLLNENNDSISFIKSKPMNNILKKNCNSPVASAFELHKRKIMPLVEELLIEKKHNPKVIVHYDLYKKDGSLNVSGIAKYLKEDNADEIEVGAEYIRTDILPKILDHKEFNHLVRN